MVLKIVKLIDSNKYIFENKPYGNVDVRTSKSETDEEKQAAIESLNSFNYVADDKNIIRLVSIFENESIEKAMIDSELLFEETIDLLKRQFITKINNCDGAGYWVNMKTGKTMPILKKKEVEEFPSMNSYEISLGHYSPMFGEQFISSNRKVEVIEAFIRSTHWYNDSSLQNKLYLKFLYKWIAIETITKIEFDEDIVPKLCLVLGFPLKKYSQVITKQKMNELKAIENYEYHKRIIKKIFYECRDIRNKIVHSGFKETILFEKDMELTLYLIDSAYTYMMNTIIKIVFTGKTKLEEIWDVMCEYVIGDENLIKMISGTLFWQMDNIISKRDK